MKDFISKQVVVVNEFGLHARAASQFVKLAGRFKADIFIEKGGIKINGKSIMGILMLAAAKGSRLTILTRGEDADMAMHALVKLVKNKFNEE